VFTSGRGGRGGGLPGTGDPGGGVPQGRPDLLDVDLDDGALLPLAGLVGATSKLKIRGAFAPDDQTPEAKFYVSPAHVKSGQDFHRFVGVTRRSGPATTTPASTPTTRTSRVRTPSAVGGCCVVLLSIEEARVARVGDAVRVRYAVDQREQRVVRRDEGVPVGLQLAQGHVPDGSAAHVVVEEQFGAGGVVGVLAGVVVAGPDRRVTPTNRWKSWPDLTWAGLT
jgi:hypothetical protein